MGIVAWQGDLDSGGKLGNAGGDFDEAQSDRIELGGMPSGCLVGQPSQEMQQPERGGVDQEPELIGRGPGAGGAV